MNKARLEMLSDGFFAVIMTVMVLGLKPPAGTSFASLAPQDPIFLSYFLSFLFMAIYWNNHHLLFQMVKTINSSVVWANFMLLFWMSLIPFCISWIGIDGFAQSPVTLYGIILLFTTLSFQLMVYFLIKIHGKDWILLRAIPHEKIGLITILVYLLAIGCSFYFPKLAFSLYVLAVILRIIPERRIEKFLFK
jgi:uncharacterized membrane protein